MRAQLLHDYSTGAFSESEVERPHAAKGQVLVRIMASGVNPIDTKIRAGVAPYAMPDLPAILGTDLAGVVEAVGEGVTSFQPGDEVYGLTGGVRGLPGSLAQFAAVDADLLALKPKDLTMREAAAIPLVFLTAWEGLIDRARLKAGQRVLIQGGAGGVGHAAVQIAAAKGATVYATASNAKAAIIEAYGATAIDYATIKVEEIVEKFTGGEGFDIVYDTVGGEVLDDSLIAARNYGEVVSCAAFGTHTLAPSSLKCVTISGVFVLLPMLTGKGRAHHGQILAQATRLVDTGQFKPLLDERRFSLAEIQAAHALQESGNVVGKLVIDID